jgi:hypothetical protein
VKGWTDFVFAFHDADELGPRVLGRIRGLRDRPAVGRYRFGEPPVVGAPEGLSRLAAELRALRSRADEAREEDRRGAGVRSGRLGGDASRVYFYCGLRDKERCSVGEATRVPHGPHGTLAQWPNDRRRDDVRRR